MKLLLISVFLISLVCFMSIPDVFGVTYPINVPMGAAGQAKGTGFSPDIIKYKVMGIITENPDSITPVILWLIDKIDVNCGL